MNEVHFYSNKTKNLLSFITSAIFCTAFIYSYEDLQNKKLTTVIISHLAFLLFTFGSGSTFLLLIRKKPLLTITNTEIIIYNLLSKTISVKFENISNFYIHKSTYRGIKTTESINIVYNRKNKQKFFGSHNIQTNTLNVKTEDLLKILNSYLQLSRS
ncbi:STM3941 family protein [Chryseobacterium sp. MYb264]|uniref:STM3941 family protein n=1 Tax=Chryseobacterium sp. MYb264 TaxID=2745153 RepID=UPI003FA34460